MPMEPVRSQPPDDAQRSALLFVQVLSRMMDLEVELPAELMDEPYLCAWFMREFAYWLLQYVDDYCKLSQDE